MTRKPIRVFYSVLSRRFYATKAWREVRPGVVEVTGEKYDVTDDIAGIIEREGVTFHAADQEQIEEGGRQEHRG